MYLIRNLPLPRNSDPPSSVSLPSPIISLIKLPPRPPLLRALLRLPRPRPRTGPGASRALEERGGARRRGGRAAAAGGAASGGVRLHEAGLGARRRGEGGGLCTGGARGARLRGVRLHEAGLGARRRGGGGGSCTGRARSSRGGRLHGRRGLRGCGRLPRGFGESVAGARPGGGRGYESARRSPPRQMAVRVVHESVDQWP